MAEDRAAAMAATERFDEHAKTWDTPDKIEMSTVASTMIRGTSWWKKAPLKNGMVIDFGCGTGLLSMQLVEELEGVYGVDLSEGMIGQFQAKLDAHPTDKPSRALTVDITSAAADKDIPDNGFDVAFSLLALHHVADPIPVLNAVARKLKNGGRIAFIDFEHTENAERFHPAHLKVGHELERHGVTEEDLKAWTAATGVLQEVEITRKTFVKPPGAGHTHGHHHHHHHQHDDHHNHQHEDEKEEFVMIMVSAVVSK